jgi:hypothetical protein
MQTDILKYASKVQETGVQCLGQQSNHFSTHTINSRQDIHISGTKILRRRPPTKVRIILYLEIPRTLRKPYLPHVNVHDLRRFEYVALSPPSEPVSFGHVSGYANM